jgi:hypothetical protein
MATDDTKQPGEGEGEGESKTGKSGKTTASKAPAKKPKRLRYVNTSKLNQTVYVKGVAIRVPVGDTVLLPPDVASKHRNIFTLKNPEDAKYIDPIVDEYEFE